MAKDSKIEWTHHTFNPWWGCEKVSPACQFCYAETWAKRTGSDVWGKHAPRRFFSDNQWAQPLKWQKEAAAANERRRVFCASMADVFEDRRDLDTTRTRLWKLIERTPNLDWLLLTKRPECIESMIPWAPEAIPANVWLGTTVESQKYADERLPHLLKHAAAVRFLSCEPLLGEVDLTQWMHHGHGINWIIAGGESGANARPMDPAWARSLRDQAAAAEVPFHFKQWGHWSPDANGKKTKIIGTTILSWHSKKDAGRELDGCIHDGFPL